MKETEEELIQEFEMFDDWMDKYNYIIELGKDLPMIDPQFKTEEFLISGCQSQVWLHPDMRDGKLYFSSPTRSNGLASMIKQIKLYALAYTTQQS